MEIKIDQFFITSDKYQYVLYEDKLVKNKETNEVREARVKIGYYTSFEHVFLKILEHNIKQSTITDIKEIISIISSTRLFIRKASNAIIEVMKDLPKEILNNLPDAKPESLEELVKTTDEVAERADAKIALGKKRRKKTDSESEEDQDPDGEPEEEDIDNEDLLDGEETEEVTEPAPEEPEEKPVKKTKPVKEKEKTPVAKPVKKPESKPSLGKKSMFDGLSRITKKGKRHSDS